MSEYVWVSNARADTRLTLFLTADIVGANVDRAIKAQTLMNAGKPVSQDMCPRKIWGDADKPSIGTLPDLFKADGYWIVSGRAADAMCRFDMGHGDLYPVDEGVFQADRKTRVFGEYFTWIFGNEKGAFLEQHSPGADPFIGFTSRDWCDISGVMKDDDIAVSSNALVGADVWVDPNLFRAFFVSGPLGDAMGHDLRKAFRLFRCPVM